MLLFNDLLGGGQFKRHSQGYAGLSGSSKEYEGSPGYKADPDQGQDDHERKEAGDGQLARFRRIAHLH